MDFIERLFHISPDGGNGSLEVLYAVTLILSLVVLTAALRRPLIGFLTRWLESLGRRRGEDRFDS